MAIPDLSTLNGILGETLNTASGLQNRSRKRRGSGIPPSSYFRAPRKGALNPNFSEV
jgi:hypothetical protein